MQDNKTLSEHGVCHDNTIYLSRRLRGGAKGWQLVIKPRIQKDKWSEYWKVSMECLASPEDWASELATEGLDWRQSPSAFEVPASRPADGVCGSVVIGSS